MVSTKACVCVTIVVAGSVVLLLVLLIPRTGNFRSTFKERCEAYGKTSDFCESLLNTFQQAYVGKEEFGFAETNYDQLFALYPFSHQCNKTMLWSGAKGVARRFAEETGSITLDRTLLGSVLDELKWCGKEGSNKTFTNNCDKRKPNPVTAFWSLASAKFAEHACGTVTAILDGERNEPYYPNTTFASVEVPKLRPDRVKNLQLLLVKKKNEGHCSCDSLGNLRKDLNNRIGCSCQVTSGGNRPIEGVRVLPFLLGSVFLFLFILF